MVAAEGLTSRSEYDARTAAGERLEFDDGQLIEIPNNDSLHDRLKARLVRQLNRQLPDPAEAANEHSFEIGPNQVRHPDVAVCLHPQAAVPGEKLQGAPDLAVEIVSPSESAQDLHRKVQLYLESGSRAVWVIWPLDREIDIHQRNQPTRHLGPDSIIENEEPLPDFKLPVASLFD